MTASAFDHIAWQQSRRSFLASGPQDAVPAIRAGTCQSATLKSHVSGPAGAPPLREFGLS